jgi:hypothetical protein
MASTVLSAPMALMPASTEPEPVRTDQGHAGDGNAPQADEPDTAGGQATSSTTSGGAPEVRHRIVGKRAAPSMEENEAKKARVEAEMLIGEIDRIKCEVNEEEAPNVKVSAVLTPEVESVIKKEELDRLEEFKAYDAVPRSSAQSKVLSLTWVMEQRSGEWRARLCARPFGKVPRPKDELYTPTPFPSTIRAMLVYAHLHGLAVRFFDVRRAFLHTPIREDVWIEPPPEWPNPHDEVWHLRCTLYGLQEAMVDFDTYFDEVVQGKVSYEGYPVLGMSRNLTDPASWRGEGVNMAKHVDDGIVVGKSHDIDAMLEKLGKYFILKVTDELSIGHQEKLLGSLITRTPDGFSQECLPAHIDKYLKILNMETCSSVSTPGEKADTRRPDEIELDPQEAETYRSAVGLALFFVQFRPECLYAVKECSRGMRQPTVGDLRRAKRIARYLRGSRGLVLKLTPKLEEIQKITCACDSDWAKDMVDRKSTTGVAVFWAGALITALSRTQGTVALSAAEAESYAMCSGAAEGLGLRSLLVEMGLQTQVDLEIKSDSSAAISGMSRLGLGKLMKHVQTKYLFLQELVRNKMVNLVKIDTKLNVADVLTKNVTKEILERHKRTLGLWAPAKEFGEVSAGHRNQPGVKQVVYGLRSCLMGLLALIEQVDAQIDAQARDLSAQTGKHEQFVHYFDKIVSYQEQMVTYLKNMTLVMFALLFVFVILGVNVTYIIHVLMKERPVTPSEPIVEEAIDYRDVGTQTEPEDLQKYTIESLRSELREHGMTTMGNKNEVIERVMRLRAGVRWSSAM